ncbi:hypothetical protein J2X72_003012 [Phyllobacterium sp. 1468]|uniref:hypothetical protein n=1 Tax=Phyllobacterium sp. 1468 TaxID=2817759 RepID=UPI00285CF66C|nr:hypothetical protein [Phyllobacterium sp. 1468]MDR6634212.1 hypothetical protein [Phyllobacterium sp. 1468]
MSTENQTTDNAVIDTNTTSTDEWDQMNEQTFEKLISEVRDLDHPELVERVEGLAKKWREQQKQLAILSLQPIFVAQPLDLHAAIAYNQTALQGRLDRGHRIGGRSNANS